MKKIFLFLLLVVLSHTIVAQKVLPQFEHYFKEAGFKGSFSLYDLNKKEYATTDKADFTVATSPASTFKVPNTFIALEEKAVADEKEIIKWDGTPKRLKIWEKDYDLDQAYKNSAFWFYQEIAKKVGEKRYHEYLKALGYGNQDISAGLTMFWLGSSLKISPKNQLEVLQKIQAETAPFSARTYRIGKEIMVEKRTDEYVLRAKTGWADTKPTHVGWYVGYVETKDNAYFFATRLYQPDAQQSDDFGNQRKEITKKILADLGIL
ncbi:class D beta-lactamase [Persicitalea jodogahamensis]|uniref:beta-lactamase n=1 Tax=Persicitalea jodogahamensis TaxID=402147 RepID=A0A8J3G9D4_9BACT|nr:class D beta-lactamase [Persicitalea jodogahamensis]GHB73738.1 putative beta-lactamase YbxI [Persicitalea jodogahamensis]